jgi:hypothetical protein
MRGWRGWSWASWQYHRDEGNYVRQIQSLKTETPLALPRIKPLKAERARSQKRRGKVANFSRGRL